MNEPTEMDRLDPAARPPRRQARRTGPEERGVRDSLKLMPEADPALAAMALAMARQLDEGELPYRDAMTARGQIRQCITQLHDWAPRAAKNDTTDELKRRREQQMKIRTEGAG